MQYVCVSKLNIRKFILAKDFFKLYSYVFCFNEA